MFLVIRKLSFCEHLWHQQDEISACAIVNSLQAEQEISLLMRCHTPIWEKHSPSNWWVIHVVLSKCQIHAAGDC